MGDKMNDICHGFSRMIVRIDTDYFVLLSVKIRNDP